MGLNWRILLALTLARTAMGVQFQAVPAMAPWYLDTLGLGYAALGALAGAYLVPGIVAALAGGWLSSRLGDIRTATGGLALMALGGAGAAVLMSFEGQMAARLLAGTGAVALNVVVTKMAGDWFEGRRDLPTAMAVLVTSWPFGIALAMVVLPPLAGLAGPVATLLLAPAFTVVSLVILALTWRAPGTAAAAQTGARTRPTRRETGLVVTAGLIWAIYNAAFINVIVWAPGALVAAGQGEVAAGAMVSLIGWVTILSIPLGGWLAGRLRRPDLVPLASFAASGALVLALLPVAGGAAAPLVLAGIGLAFGPAAGLVMALPVGVTRPAVRALLMGLFFAIYYLVMALAPPAMGRLLEVTGDAFAPLLASAALFLACLGLWWAFRAMERR